MNPKIYLISINKFIVKRNLKKNACKRYFKINSKKRVDVEKNL